MSPLGTAISVEFCKTRKSYTIQTITVLVVLGIAILAGSLLAAARRGNEQILTQLGPLADETGWNQLTGISCQITAAGALLAFGVALAWLFGREFADSTPWCDKPYLCCSQGWLRHLPVGRQLLEEAYCPALP